MVYQNCYCGKSLYDSLYPCQCERKTVIKDTGISNHKTLSKQSLFLKYFNAILKKLKK